MRIPRHLSILALLAATLAACQAPPPVAGVPGIAPFPGAVAGAARGRVVVAPSVVGGGLRRLLGVVQAYTEGTIHHVKVELFHPSDLVTPRDTVTLAADEIYNPLTFSNLDQNKTYRVQASAYKGAFEDGSTLISVPSCSYVDLVVASDDRPALGNLPICLADQTFSGEAATTGVPTITEGVVSHAAGNEGATLETPVVVEWAETIRTLTGGNFRDLALDSDGDIFFVDKLRGVVWKIQAGGTVATVFAGDETQNAAALDGVGAAAHFHLPSSIAIAPDDTIYVGEEGALRRISNPGADVLTVAGEPGVTGDLPVANDYGSIYPRDARFETITDLIALPHHELLLLDRANKRVRIRNADGGIGNFGPDLGLFDPAGIALGRDNRVYFSDPGHKQIYRFGAGNVTNVAPTAYSGVLDTGPVNDGPLAFGRYAAPTDLAFDRAGNLFVVDQGQVRRVDALQELTSIGGSPGGGAPALVDGILEDEGGPGDARFGLIGGLAIFGGRIYLTDPDHDAIRRLRETPL